MRDYSNASDGPGGTKYLVDTGPGSHWVLFPNGEEEHFITRAGYDIEDHIQEVLDGPVIIPREPTPTLEQEIEALKARVSALEAQPNNPIARDPQT